MQLISSLVSGLRHQCRQQWQLRVLEVLGSDLGAVGAHHVVTSVAVEPAGQTDMHLVGLVVSSEADHVVGGGRIVQQVLA